MLNSRKILSVVAALVLAVAAAVTTPVMAGPELAGRENVSETQRVRVPLNLAILIQDDLVPRVGNELGVTRKFIRSLPAGSRVMIGYIRSGSLQVRQHFTGDLELAAEALRIPAGSTSVSPFNPYLEVIEALRLFDGGSANPNALLLISDGLDVSRGFDITSNANTLDLRRAIREAKDRNVAVYSFYAPSVGLTGWNRTAASYGQSSLNRLSNETGGRAFFQGLSFVTFDSHFDRLSRTLNERYASAE